MTLMRLQKKISYVLKIIIINYKCSGQVVEKRLTMIRKVITVIFVKKKVSKNKKKSI